MLIRFGLLLSCVAWLLQIAVFLQPLLPEQFQVARVCETIAQSFNDFSAQQHQHHLTHHATSLHDQHDVSHETSAIHHHAGLADQSVKVKSSHQHDVTHQCQYCTVLGHLVLPPAIGVQTVLERIQVRLLIFKQTFVHVYFALQRLFLMPQGRAPPVFA